MWFDQARPFLRAVVAVWLVNGNQPVSIEDIASQCRIAESFGYMLSAMNTLIGQKCLEQTEDGTQYLPTAYGVYAAMNQD